MSFLNKLLLQTLVVIASGLCLIVGASLVLDGVTNKKLKSVYERAAVNALAVSAATAIQSTAYNDTNLRFWSAEGPCLKTTMQYTLHPPNGRSFSPKGWPHGSHPNCEDFFSTSEQSYDAEIAFPSNCYPAFTHKNVGGPKGSYVVVAADDANLLPLRNAQLSPEALIYLRDTDDEYSNGMRTSQFIRAGGLEGVDIALIETQSCPGFSLFRFQTNVLDLKSMRETMQGVDGTYSVGLK